MAMHDEVKEQQQKLKGKTFREKLDYFWYYYKVHTIVALFVIIVGTIFIRDAVTAKDSAFSAVLLNALGNDSQEMIESDFAAYSDIDLEVYDCYIDTGSTLSYDTMSQMDLAVSQRIVALTQTGGIDVLISNSEPFANFSQGMMFKDLREELTAEEYARFEPDFFYIDAAALDADDAEPVYDENGMVEIVDTSIDHADPSAMKDPVPVGIYLKSVSRLKEYNCYPDSSVTPIFGFPATADHPDKAHLFLKYLTE